MSEPALFLLFWGGYAAWLALFWWIAWRGKVRLLLGLGSVMLLSFAGSYAGVQSRTAAETFSPSASMAYGLLMMFAAAVLIGPLVVAAVAYPIGRYWPR